MLGLFVATMFGHTNPAFTLSRYAGIRTGTDTTTSTITACRDVSLNGHHPED